MSYVWLIYALTSLTVCVGVVSHLLLFLCLAKDPLKCFRNSASYLIINLAVADFVVCLGALIVLSLVHNFPAVLSVRLYALPAFAWASIFSIFSIAVDRYLLTVRPFTHRVLLNGRRIAIWIATTWLLSMWPVLKTSIFGFNKVGSIIYHTIIVVFSLLTVLIYLITYFSLRKQGRFLSGQRQSQNRSQKEFLKTITIVAFIQILTFVPQNVLGLLDGLSYGSSSIVEVISFQVYFLNFATNPVLYFWRLTNYRRTLRLIVCRKTE
jgi:hypothetical protein